jgi:hypothetical protein
MVPIAMATTMSRIDARIDGSEAMIATMARRYAFENGDCLEHVADDAINGAARDRIVRLFRGPSANV